MAFRLTALQAWLRELLCLGATTAQIHNEAPSLPRWHCGIQGQNSQQLDTRSPADRPAQGSKAGPSAGMGVRKQVSWQHSRVALDFTPGGV